jgi:galactokinase
MGAGHIQGTPDTVQALSFRRMGPASDRVCRGEGGTEAAREAGAGHGGCCRRVMLVPGGILDSVERL